MKKSILRLERYNSADPGTYRTIFKNQHGRVLFLALTVQENACAILDCFYLDLNQEKSGEDRRSARPKKLRTVRFPVADLLSVIGNELDKQFYGIEYEESNLENASTEAYIRKWECLSNCKYRFLVMTGEGELRNGLPVKLRTRLKNKLHRSVYVELEYYKDGKGVVKECFYYDREYRQRKRKVIPPMLLSCFFPYTKEGILNLINQEICCEFTHMLITDDINIDTNTTPLCGSI